MAVGTFLSSGANATRRTLSWGTPMPLVPLRFGECEESDMVRFNTKMMLYTLRFHANETMIV